MCRWRFLEFQDPLKNELVQISVDWRISIDLRSLSKQYCFERLIIAPKVYF